MDGDCQVDGLVGSIDGAGARGADHALHAVLVADRGGRRGNEGVAAGDLQRVERVDGGDVALTLLDYRLEVLVVDLLLLVGDLEEAVVDLVELGVVEGVAELAETMTQGGVAGARRQDDLGAGGANVGRVDDLVGVASLEDAVLVDAR